MNVGDRAGHLQRRGIDRDHGAVAEVGDPQGVAGRVEALVVEPAGRTRQRDIVVNDEHLSVNWRSGRCAGAPHTETPTCSDEERPGESCEPPSSVAGHRAMA